MKVCKIRHLTILVFLILNVFLFLHCGKEQQQEAISQDSPLVIAFINVNIVPMDSERTLERQTVIVRNKLIDKIGPATKVKIPKSAVMIDASDKYLMPGLADMHVHAWRENDLLLFIANGVTTIRNMWGSPLHLKWKRLISKGELLGPTVITAGPLLDGPNPIWEQSTVIGTPERAEKEVAAQKKAGYDFIKVYNNLSKEAFDAIMSAAKNHDIPVAGHVPHAVALEHVLASRMNAIEHLTGYPEMIEADDSPVKGKAHIPSMIRRLNYVDEAKIPSAVSATVEARIWNCPTLVVFQGFVSPDEAKDLFKRPEMKYVDPMTRASWDSSKDFRFKDITEEDYKTMKKGNAIYIKLTGELHKAGARILLGTDTPNPFVVPGFSIHNELQNLVNAGLTPYEAIKAGTYDAAEFLEELDTFGIIAPGRRADMILIEENPLADVAHVGKRVGVMIQGKWFPEKELQKMLEDLVVSYSAPKKR